VRPRALYRPEPESPAPIGQDRPRGISLSDGYYAWCTRTQEATQGEASGEDLEQEVDLPRVEGEEPEGAANEWLFDSRRDYLDQLDHYKASYVSAFPPH
jgi:hypothetical protein